MNTKSFEVFCSSIAPGGEAFLYDRRADSARYTIGQVEIPSDISENFLVQQITIGVKKQLTGPVPAHMISGQPLITDVWHPGMDLIIKVKNTSKSFRDFRATIHQIFVP